MPTNAERVDADSFNGTLQESFLSWTDDLPVCHYSGVGCTTNQVYQADGTSKEEHEYLNRSFHFSVDSETSFYGVFDGHCGCRAVEFASQRLPAEILLGQLKDKDNDLEIKELLQQAFLTVETSFFQSIDNLLAEKEDLKLQLQGFDLFESVKQEPVVVQKLNSIIAEIGSGATAVVALVYKKKLYVANAGDCRAVLCKSDESGKTQVYQLSMDHNFQNEDELLRLSQLGLDINVLRSGGALAEQNWTRCIGNYAVKGGYKEFGNLSEASEEPIIAEPEVVGGINLDKDCSFLILMSNGLYKSLKEATGTNDANKMVVQLLNEQFPKHESLSGVAQAVVNKVVQLHHEEYLKTRTSPNSLKKHGDITMLVLNIAEFLSKDDEIRSAANALPLISPNATPVYCALPFHDHNILPIPPRPGKVPNSPLRKSANLDTSAGEPDDSLEDVTPSASETMSAEDARIMPYVDFTDFYNAAEEAYKKGEVPSEWRRQSSK